MDNSSSSVLYRMQFKKLVVGIYNIFKDETHKCNFPQEITIQNSELESTF